MAKPRKSKPLIVFGSDAVLVWNSHHRCHIPFKLENVMESPQWKTFVADAVGKAPTLRTADEKRAVAISMANTPLTWPTYAPSSK